ncbi:hypothetical protein RB195_020194 [Necator americanus]|uniref:Uncharacterized protein n=1 Tax=Necator americanus TaxID=51031 RepID=A0ABR1CL83_NECAM
MAVLYTFLLALLVAFIQSSHGYFPYAGYFDGYPGFGFPHLVDPYYGAVMVPAPRFVTTFPYALHSHFYHPRSAFRNIAKSYRKEDGHLSDTSFISPIRKNIY